MLIQRGLVGEAIIYCTLNGKSDVYGVGAFMGVGLLLKMNNILIYDILEGLTLKIM